jgi:type II restriction enzyme
MALSDIQKKDIENVLKTSLRKKFTNHNPEPAYMPFHTRLLGKDRLALYSFIHSLNTNFGTTIFEPVAVALSKKSFKSGSSQTIAGEYISEGALFVIQEIMDKLAIAESMPDKENEIKRIRAVCKEGRPRKIKPTKIDLELETESGEFFLIDLKTAKPNAGGFKGFKRTLLEWVGVKLFQNPEVEINTLIAIPYNPYEPQPYNRWTIRGMLDLDKELKVGKEFWDFLGGENAYEDLLDCFEKVGLELKEEIDIYFANFSK